jgi:ArsR family transcriptional regulator
MQQLNNRSIKGVIMTNEICNCEIIHKDIVDEVKKIMISNEKTAKLSLLYKMFAGATRIKILWALSRHEMCVCDLSALLNMTKSAVSHQLATLKMMDLIKNKKSGKVVFYSLADGHIESIFAQGIEHIEEKVSN